MTLVCLFFALISLPLFASNFLFKELQPRKAILAGQSSQGTTRRASNLYSHYFFASGAAHIGAMFTAFLSVSTALGTPPLLGAMVLSFLSNLMGGLTHYGIGSAPVFYGANYVPLAEWWGYGFIIFVVNIVIWLGIGGFWWKVLGLW